MLIRMAPDLWLPESFGSVETGQTSAQTTSPEADMIWASVLGMRIADVKSEDNFFRLGGDSLLAMRLVTAARNRHLSLSVSEVFNHPTLNAMALQTNPYAVTRGLPINSFSLLNPSCHIDHILQEAALQCCVDETAIEDIYPCTALQAGMMSLTAKDSQLYQMQVSFLLSNEIDLDRFQSAWNRVATTLSLLRTRFFQPATSELLQTVTKTTPKWSNVLDRGIEAFLLEDKQEGFRLGGPTCRFALVMSANSEKKHFVWSIHHSVLDGWTLRKIVDRVQQAYRLLPISPWTEFKSFIHTLSRLNLSGCDEFWASQLADFTPAAYPLFPERDLSQPRWATVNRKMQLSGKTSCQFTVSTMLRGAWALLLGAYSNSTDICFGVTVTGRNLQDLEFEDLIGPTIATVPLRINFKRQQTVEKFLGNIQHQTAAMMPFEQAGLKRIRCLNPGAQAACLFQNLLIIHPVEASGSCMADDCSFLSQPRIDLSLNYPLTVECSLTSAHIHLSMKYDEGRFDDVQIQRLASQFEHTCSQVFCFDSMQCVCDMELITPEDMNTILQLNKEVPVSAQTTLDVLLTEQFELRGENPAICSWDGNMDYTTLGLLGERLSQYLTKLGVRPGVFVPICFDKSVWAIVAMLGIILSGGALVAMDPRHPRLRLQGLVERLKAKLILSSSEYVHLFDAQHVNVFVVANELLQRTSLDHREPIPRIYPKTPAYVIFTSGSTGDANAIVIEHEAICTSALTHGKFMHFGPTSRVLQFAAFTFDISISDIFTTLLHGGCICIPSEHERINDLPSAIESLRVNQACLTATVAQILEPLTVPGLRILAVSGEPLTDQVVRKWAEHVFLINMYGPAECTIYATGRADISSAVASSDIGQGVGALRWIVDPDDHNNLMPVGAVGELLLEGPILSKGYLDDNLTQRLFVSDPCWSRGNNSALPRRFYKTGDLVRYDSLGSLHYVDRKDTMVKVRGYRVELGEIEHYMRVVLGPSFVVAADVIEDNGRKSLVAYVSSQIAFRSSSTADNKIPSSGEKSSAWATELLRRQLPDLLPHYMIPADFVTIPRMPLSTSGKLDRKELRRSGSKFLSEQRMSLFSETSAKKVELTHMQTMLRDFWSECLNVNAAQISLDDSFFVHGGDSVSAMRLVAIARKSGYNLTVKSIFERQTLVRQAVHMRAVESQNFAPLLPFELCGGRAAAQVLRAKSSTQCKTDEGMLEDIYPCTPCQEFYMDHSVHYPCQTGRSHGSAAQFVYSLPVGMDSERFRSTWDRIVTSHAILRTRVVRIESKLFQVVLKRGDPWCTSFDVDSYLTEDKRLEFQYGSPLHRRCLIFDRKSSRQLFIWTAQHAIFDGWSRKLLDSEVEKAYNDPTQPLYKTQFNRFIKYVTEVDRKIAGQFWYNQFRDLESKPLLQSPVGYGPRSVLKANASLILTGATVPITMPNMVSLAWSLVIANATGSNDVVLDLTSGGRASPIWEVERMIAPTVSHVPCRIQLDCGSTTLQQLRHIQDRMTEMLDYETFGFQNIRELSDETRRACENAVHTTINPHVPAITSESVPGIKLISSEPLFHLPTALTFNCEINEKDLSITITYDDSIVQLSLVTTWLRQFSSALRTIYRAGSTQTVADLNMSVFQREEGAIIGV